MRVNIVADYQIEFKGLDSLTETIIDAAKLDDVKLAIKHHTANMARYAARQVPVKTGYLRRSEQLSLEEAGLAGRVSFLAYYAPYQEYGTRWFYGKFYLKKSFDQASQEFIMDLERMFS